MMGIYLPAVFLSNGLAVALCLNIFFSYRRQIRSTAFDERIFLAVCMATIIQAVIESVAYVLDGKSYPGNHTILYLLPSINFVLSSVISLLFVLYVDYKLFLNLDRIKKCLPFLCIPVVATVVLSVINAFFPIFFYIAADNTYQRGPFILFSFVQVYVYMIYTLGMTLLHQKKQERYVFMPVLLYVVPVYVGSILQILIYGMPFIWVCEALGLTAIYINLQNETSYLDPLTGLYNRSYLFKYLESAWKRRGSMQGLLLDMNAFKQINDTYGHIEGDIALRTVGKILVKTVPHGCLAARYAGDEFVVVVPKHANVTAKQVKEMIEQAADTYNAASKKPYQISFSIGICTQKVEKIDEFLNAMDKEMYCEKRSFYEQANHDRRALRR